MPTSGDYYLNSDVEFSEAVTLTDDLRLYLNGKTLSTSTFHINVPDGITFTIFEDGEGQIIGGFERQYGDKGLITIASGGTLVISEGRVENVCDAGLGEGSYAIYNNGTLHLSGAPAIVGEDAGIYLGSSKVITIDGALSNDSPYSVYKALTGDFTSGWNTAMGSAKPSAYFTSANANFGVCRNGNEAKMVRALSLAGTIDNASTINTYHEQVVNVTLASRTIISASYNTICLPFALTDAQLQEVFGSGYDLEAFNNSELESDILTLNFERAYALTAGQPYLIQPAADVVNPTFEGVTIDNTNRDQTSDTYTSFHGIYSPTELKGGNKNILFLGANNTLFWPESTGDIYGFRAYFEIKGGAATAARHVRMSVQDTAEQTAVHELTNDNNRTVRKHISNGQILIEHNGAIYNIMGQKIE